MPLVIVAIGVVLLLLLMIRFKLNGFIALVLVALAVGLMQGMPLVKVISSIKAGVGLRGRTAYCHHPDCQIR